MRDVGRLSLALGVVALATIVGLAGLAQLKFSAFLSDSVGERLEIVGRTAAQDFGAAIDHGLSVAEVANGRQILERARGHDRSISGIAVFDLDAAILHTAGDIPDGEIDPRTQEAFRVVVLEDAVDAWSIEAGDQIRSGVVIDGSFGQPVGGVVVHYPVTEMREQEASMMGSLLFDAAWIGLVVLIVVGIVFAVLRRREGGDDPEADQA